MIESKQGIFLSAKQQYKTLHITDKDMGTYTVL